MRIKFLGFLQLTALLFVLSCSPAKEQKPVAEAKAVATFEIEGMVCKMGCAETINKKLLTLDGVVSSEVDFEAKTARVEFDPAYTSAEVFKSTVTGLEYEVKNVRTFDKSSQGSQEINSAKPAKTHEKVGFKPIVFPDVFQGLKKIL